MIADRGRRIGFACALLLLPLLFVSPTEATAARIEVRKILDTSPLGEPFVFDVDPDGRVLVLTRENVFDAGSGESLFGHPLKDPAWLSFAGKGLRLLADGALYSVDGGAARKLLDVPLKSCVFASDGERIFIGGVAADGKPMLFLYQEGAGHKALLGLDAPIDSMAIARGELFFSAGPRIYALREGGPARVLAYLPGFSHIPSLAVDEGNGLLYFSDGDDIYALRGEDFVLVKRGIGGMLRSGKGELHVLSWNDHALFRLSGLPAALSSAGALSPLKDPCKAPDMSLYCKAALTRAVLRTLGELSASPSDMAEEKKELVRIMAGLEKEAEAGSGGIRWGGGLEPKTIRPNDVFTTGREGIGVTLWDGSEIRVGPDSKAVVGDCGPGRECRQILENGLLYFESAKPPVEGMAIPAIRGVAIATEALKASFSSARVVVHASGGR
ncbi:MAG: hypothetical protein H6Q84_3476, partial [Deltaproteobacteria bacterium]|nr:hypothetical protein [Deltaproteobacteria bacterium]